MEVSALATQRAWGKQDFQSALAEEAGDGKEASTEREAKLPLLCEPSGERTTGARSVEVDAPDESRQSSRDETQTESGNNYDERMARRQQASRSSSSRQESSRRTDERFEQEARALRFDWT